MNQIIQGRFAVMPYPPREGGNSLVYQACDLHRGGQMVAVKIFNRSEYEAPLLQEFFLRETEALADLKHPNVVEMISSGYDPTRESHFVVLEWVELQLPEYLRVARPLTWSAFASQIAIPLLDGLATAHSRGVFHRDIKPSNVLVFEGAPKLADFSIAKHLRTVRKGLTVAEFASKPYTPPERSDDPARDDLFSFGATLIACLAPADFELSYASLHEGISSCGVPREIAGFISRLVELDPSQRPLNARSALAELQDLQAQGNDAAYFRPTFYLTIPQTKQRLFASTLQCTSTRHLQELILRDLADECAVNYPSRPGREFRLYGREFSYRVRLDDITKSRLFLDGIQLPVTPSQLDHWRESGLPLDASFSFASPTSVTESRDEVDALLVALTDHVEQQRNERLEREQRQLYRRWNSLLQAAEELEAIREAPIDYTGYEIEGSVINFRLADDPTDDIRGQSRMIKTSRGLNVTGIVDEVSEKTLSLFIQDGTSLSLPNQGSLIVDTTRSKIAISRQWKALNDIQFDRAARSDVGKLLLDPPSSASPLEVPQIHFVQDFLDPVQQAAVAAALGAPDFLAVQGPPGTGKTTWIAEVACQFKLQRPESRILLSAQTQIAVDNALEAIQKLNPDLIVVRIGSGERMKETIRPVAIREQMGRWREKALAQSNAFLAQLAEEQGISPSRWTLATHLNALRLAEERREGLSARVEQLETQLREIKNVIGDLQLSAESVQSVVEGIASALRSRQGEIADSPLFSVATSFVKVGQDLRNRINQESASLVSATEAEDDLAELQLDHQIALHDLGEIRERIQQLEGDEGLHEKTTTELIATIDAVLRQTEAGATWIEQLQALQGHWFQRFGQGPEFDAALLTSADVVAGTCVGLAGADRSAEVSYDLVIIDEASKATPTEALVPISRGRRWVIVGDPNQLPPFADDALRKNGLLDKYGLEQDDLTTTLFDHLLAQLPETCLPYLSIQHRMTREIGDLISASFYRNKLTTRRVIEPDAIVRKVFSRPVLWLSTSALHNRAESRGGRGTQVASRSWLNVEEARRIRSLLTKLEVEARERGLALSVAVLTGYMAQKNYLSRSLNPANSETWRCLQIEVNTVDAFQGRQVDVAVYSVTRSNQNRELGFLRSRNRLNVALSRGRDGLVIVGDLVHCKESKDLDNPFLDVIDYIESNPQTCRIEVLS